MQHHESCVVTKRASLSVCKVSFFGSDIILLHCRSICPL